MRTKHLLTAIALPMLFAACTADELNTMDNTVKDDLSKRPVVEGVKIAFNDANTRASQGANFNTIKFEDGDKVGALLVDQLASAGDPDPIRRYNVLQTNFNTNYVFETKDGVSFSAEAYLTEGNYVFYYPFNEQRTRDQILTDLPTEQALTKGTDGVYTSFPSVLSYSETNGAPLAIAYDFISSTDAEKTVQSTMKQIYAVPLITISNGYTEEVSGKTVAKAIKIKQIVLTKDGGFKVKAPLKFASAANRTAYVEATNAVAGAQYSNTKSIVSALFNEAIPADPANVKKGFWLAETVTVAKATSDILGDAVGTGGTSGEIVLTLETPVEVAAEGSFSFYAVIPAEDYKTDVLKVKVINDKGLESSTEIALGTATLQPSKRYPVEEYAADGSSLTDAKGEALTGTVIDFDNTGVMVSTVDELINAVKNAASGELNLRLSGTAAINSRVASYLKSTSTKATSINIVNAATIEGTYTLEPKVTINFQKGITVKEGANVTFNSAKITITENDGLNIAAGAALTYKSTAELSDVTVNNAGTLKLAGNITAKAINNTGTISVDEDVTVTTNANEGFKNGNANKAAAILNIAKGKTLTLVTGTLTNKEKATINNEGNLAASGLLTNESEATINNGSTTNFDAAITSSEGTTNAGIIDNYGSVEIYTNSGAINMKTVNAKATVTAGDGSISNDVLATVTAATNTVTYTMTGAQKEIPGIGLAASINTIVLDGVTMTLEKSVGAGIDYDIVVKGATSFSSKGGAGTEVKFALSSGKTLSVAEGAVLTVNAGVVIGALDNALSITVNAEGKVVNYGTIKTSTSKGDNWSGTGTVENGVVSLN